VQYCALYVVLTTYDMFRCCVNAFFYIGSVLVSHDWHIRQIFVCSVILYTSAYKHWPRAVAQWLCVNGTHSSKGLLVLGSKSRTVDLSQVRGLLAWQVRFVTSCRLNYFFITWLIHSPPPTLLSRTRHISRLQVQCSNWSTGFSKWFQNGLAQHNTMQYNGRYCECICA
jgi:hypothetical protein